MSDDTGASPRATWEARVACGICGLLFSQGIILALLMRGDGNNPLHTSAMSWAWMLLFSVLGGFGLPAIADLLPWKKQ